MSKFILHCHKCGEVVVRDNNLKVVTCFKCKKERVMFWAKKLREKKREAKKIDTLAKK